MAVRRVRRPVAVGGQQLHAHEPLGTVKDAGGHEVGHLPRRRPRPPDFDGDGARFDMDRVEAPFGPGRGERHLGPTRRAQPDLGSARDVRPVGDLVENAVPAREAQPAPVDVYFEPSGQGEHRHFLVAGDEVDHATRRQAGHAQARAGPTRRLRGQVHLHVPLGQATGRPVQSLRLHQSGSVPANVRPCPGSCQALSRLMSGLPPPVLRSCPGQGPGRRGPCRPARPWRR